VPPQFRQNFDMAGDVRVAQNALRLQPDVHVQAIDTNRVKIAKLLTATATLDFPSIAAVNVQDLTITVTGAAVGDAVFFSLPAAPNAGVVFNAWVSAANTVKIRATNVTAGAIDPASASYRVVVMGF
jgi:hypothetical protein